MTLIRRNYIMDQGDEAAEPTQTNTTTPSQTGDNAGRPGQCAETITAGPFKI